MASAKMAVFALSDRWRIFHDFPMFCFHSKGCGSVDLERLRLLRLLMASQWWTFFWGKISWFRLVRWPENSRQLRPRRMMISFMLVGESNHGNQTWLWLKTGIAKGPRKRKSGNQAVWKSSRRKISSWLFPAGPSIDFSFFVNDPRYNWY